MPKTATVAEFDNSCRIWRQSPKTATIVASVDRALNRQRRRLELFLYSVSVYVVCWCSGEGVRLVINKIASSTPSRALLGQFLDE